MDILQAAQEAQDFIKTQQDEIEGKKKALIFRMARIKNVRQTFKIEKNN